MKKPESPEICTHIPSAIRHRRHQKSQVFILSHQASFLCHSQFHCMFCSCCQDACSSVFSEERYSRSCDPCQSTSFADHPTHRPHVATSWSHSGNWFTESGLGPWFFLPFESSAVKYAKCRRSCDSLVRLEQKQVEQQGKIENFQTTGRHSTTRYFVKYRECPPQEITFAQANSFTLRAAPCLYNSTTRWICEIWSTRPIIAEICKLLLEFSSRQCLPLHF